VSTPPDRPNSDTHAGHATAGRTASPVRALPAELSQARGRAPFGHAFGPHRGDRSPWWIYPNLFDPNTPVANPCLHAAWNRSVRRPRGNLGSKERIGQAHRA
jgi:hypothetical protein